MHVFRGLEHAPPATRRKTVANCVHDNSRAEVSSVKYRILRSIKFQKLQCGLMHFEIVLRRTETALADGRPLKPQDR